MIGAGRQRRDGAQHRQMRGAQDVERCRSPRRWHARRRPRREARIGSKSASRRAARQLLGIVEAVGDVAGVEHHGRGRHRTGERAAPDLVDAGHRRRRPRRRRVSKTEVGPDVGRVGHVARDSRPAPSRKTNRAGRRGPARSRHRRAGGRSLDAPRRGGDCVTPAPAARWLRRSVPRPTGNSGRNPSRIRQLLRHRRCAQPRSVRDLQFAAVGQVARGRAVAAIEAAPVVEGRVEARLPVQAGRSRAGSCACAVRGSTR